MMGWRPEVYMCYEGADESIPLGPAMPDPCIYRSQREAMESWSRGHPISLCTVMRGVNEHVRRAIEMNGLFRDEGREEAAEMVGSLCRRQPA